MNYQGDELTANLALFEALFASLDSLEWTPHGMSTQTLEDNSIAVVSIPSTVQLYPKDSEAEGGRNPDDSPASCQRVPSSVLLAGVRAVVRPRYRPVSII